MRRLQHVDRRLQVDHEVRHRCVDGQARIHLLVEREFLVVQGQPREQAVLVEQVVGHAHGLEQVGLAQLLQLPRTLEQEVQLGLERGSARVAIEALEKRVFVVLLEHELAAEAARQPSRKARLADADRSFDDDIAMCGGHHLDGVGDRRALECLRHVAIRFNSLAPSRCTRAATLPTPGTSSDGAISASGTSTKSRSASAAMRHA